MTIQKYLAIHIFLVAKVNLAITDGAGTTDIMSCSLHAFTKSQSRIFNFSRIPDNMDNQFIWMKTTSNKETKLFLIGENVVKNWGWEFVKPCGDTLYESPEI